MKILVAIASYGTNNDQYLAQLIREYRCMPYDICIVVCSDTHKNLGPDVEVVVGLPSKNPHSLPFAHKPIFAERLPDHDLFIYSEDDILISRRNIEAFLKVTDVLPPDEVAGFLRSETGPGGKRYFPDVRNHFHWDPSSVRSRGDDTFAFFTNEHSGCYLLTQAQLKQAHASGRFLVQPHEGRYGLLETAATDPYTQCGFKKMVCISHLDEFTVSHLSNKYAGEIGLEEPEFRRQIQALFELQNNGRPRGQLFEPETGAFHCRWSKNFYEPCEEELLALIPDGARSVLSIGCGWGATEGQLVKKGIRVAGIPMDAVISACAEAKGVEIVYGDLQAARKQLAGRKFDCILLSNILHLAKEPVGVLSSFGELLPANGAVIISVPNLPWLATVFRQIRHRPHHRDLGNYLRTRLHLTTSGMIRKWFHRCNLVPDKIVFSIPHRWRSLNQRLLGLGEQQLASSIVAMARKKAGLI